jgi:uncharacterized protein YydD (DUF2326 family)
MIRSIWASYEGFKRVEFRPGFNIVLADKTKESQIKNSRNGLGKSSLIEIIHYLLGSSGIAESKGKPLEEWTFYGTFDFSGSKITVSRTPQKNSRIWIESGDLSQWEAKRIVFESEGGRRFLDWRDWSRLLGAMVFGLPLNPEQNSPSFRSLVSYFIRRGKDAYSSPFEHFRKQKIGEVEVDNAFLLGLNWEDAKRAEALRMRASLAKELQSANKLGIVRDYFGARGELEAERSRLDQQRQQLEKKVNSYQVADQYISIEDDADVLTEQINALSNENYSSKIAIHGYQKSMKMEEMVEYIDVETIFEEVKIAFREETLQRLSDVRKFHKELTENRKSYLEDEITRLQRGITLREEQIRELDARRGRLLRTLEENRALEHYIAMRKYFDDLQERLAELNAKIKAVNEIESVKAQLKIDTELAHTATLEHYNESLAERSVAYRLFNEASCALYEKSGDLLIDVNKKGGYTFSYEIERKGSEGYGGGAIFCYDMTLVQLWSKRSSLNCLIHDSALFDPIEERQIVHALRFAKNRAESVGFQYICTINSDRLSNIKALGGENILESVVLRLSDTTEDGGLLGIRF